MSFPDQDTIGQAFQDAFEVLQQQPNFGLLYPPVSASHCEWEKHQTFTNSHPHIMTNISSCSAAPVEEPSGTWKDHLSFPEDLYPDESINQCLQNVEGNQVIHTVLTTSIHQKGVKGRKKLRLFEYLHESLYDPCMCHCIQWVDQRNGVFQFISKNKETLAEIWGKRKGNRKPMTYQKMARALRNYGRTGEIMKIRRKLTYQFNATVLQRLSPACCLGKESVCCQYLQVDCMTDNWSTNCNCMCGIEYELNQSIN
ncbi:transcription factor Spi-C [Lissotriton helveticus]